MGVSIDISGLKRMEGELHDRLKEIETLKRRLENENLYLRKELRMEKGFEKIVGESKAFQSVIFSVRQVASTDATVLLLGETGTGKGMVANAIHQLSTRKDRPLVTVNCCGPASKPHRKRAFRTREGRIHGCECPAGGALRGGRRRDHLPRRNR